jgi:hypothetical protein
MIKNGKDTQFARDWICPALRYSICTKKVLMDSSVFWVTRWFATDVLEIPIGPISKGQDVLEDVTDR